MDFSFIQMQGEDLLFVIIFVVGFRIWMRQESIVRSQNELRQHLPLKYALKDDIKKELETIHVKLESMNTKFEDLFKLILKNNKGLDD